MANNLSQDWAPLRVMTSTARTTGREGLTGNTRSRSSTTKITTSSATNDLDQGSTALDDMAQTLEERKLTRRQIDAIFGHVNRVRSGGSIITLDVTKDTNEFFNYTSGRWLWNEDQRLQERYTVFDITELKRIAAQKVGAKKCLSMTKIGEGGSNRAFRLTFDNEEAIIARLPMHHLSGPKIHSMASEVATMGFARNVLGVPAPEVLYYDTSSDNPVGSDFMLITEAKGKQLGEVWPQMSKDERTAVVHEIVQLQKRMMSVSFEMYGSLYYRKDGPPGSVTAHIQGDGLALEIIDRVARDFVIGPMVEKSYWHGDRSREIFNDKRGPFVMPMSIIDAITDREIMVAKMIYRRQEKDTSANNRLFKKSPIESDMEVHVALLEKAGLAMQQLLAREFATGHIHHEDLYYGNIFVEGTDVVALIDWQQASVSPLQFLGRDPPFLAMPEKKAKVRPSKAGELSERDRQTKEEQEAKADLLQVYRAATKVENPVLSDVFEDSRTIALAKCIEFATHTLEGSLIPLRGTLQFIRSHYEYMWPSFDDCPFRFVELEVKNLVIDKRKYADMKKFWDGLDGFVYKDGWVSKNRYHEALQMFEVFRSRARASIVDIDKLEEFTLQSRWVVTAGKRRSTS